MGFHDQVAAYLNETIRAQALATDEAVARALALGCGVRLHRWIDADGAICFQVGPDPTVPARTIYEHHGEP